MEKDRVAVFDLINYQITIKISGETKNEDTAEQFISIELSDTNTMAVYGRSFSFTNLIDSNVNWKRCFSIEEVFDILETVLKDASVIETKQDKCFISFEYTFIKSKYDYSLCLPIVELKPNDLKFHIMKILEKYKADCELKMKTLEEKNLELENNQSLKTEIKNLEEKNFELEKKLGNQISLMDSLNKKLMEYEMKLNKIENDIVEIQKYQSQNYFMKISGKKIFTILHYTNEDCYSPTADSLKTCASSIGLSLNIIEERKETQAIKNNIDAVLVSTWSDTNVDLIGKDVQSYIDSGVNVVIVLFANSTNYEPPKGNFNFIEIKADDGNGAKAWKKNMKDHPLFEGNPSVTVGSDKRRAIFGEVLCGNVEIVAQWDDGIPMIAIRKDLPGIVTQLGFQCGSSGSQDGLRIVINALRLVKC